MAINKSEVGNMLKRAYPDLNIPKKDSSFGEILTNSSPLFTFSTVLNLPQSYLNRQGRTIVICGKVIEGTKEHVSGYHYFSQEEEFFTASGQVNDDEPGPGDLVSLVDSDQESRSLYPLKTWVHPEHYNVTSFFKSLSSNKVDLSNGCHYLNRMGFVVKIVSGDNDSYYTSDDHSCYNKEGQLLTENHTPFNLSSMYDLIYVIKNWPLFSTADWSCKRIINQQDPSSLAPEEFDPTRSQREKKTKEFFDGLIKMHALSKELGISFGFHMNEPNGIGG